MHDFDFLQSLIIIFGVSALVVFLLDKLKVPSIIGFLIAGMFMGPHGLELIKELHLVEIFAEIGVVLLLFTIGLEFSLSSLLALRKTIFIGGFLQVFITCAIVFLISFTIGQSVSASLVYAFLVSLSSTAIVMRIMFERAEMDSPHGRASVGILIFQDLIAVLFMLMIPLLSGGGNNVKDIIFVLIKSLFIITAVIVSSHWIVPRLLRQIVQTRKRELFIITIIFICLGTAFFTYKLGLSLALGAFIAGLIISESEYAYQATSDILPFKDSFNGLFFISIGMLLDLNFLVSNILSVIAIIFIILLVKVFACTLAIYTLWNSLRIALQSAVILAQIGEFSFVLSVSALKGAILNDYTYQLFLSSAILTMILTPSMIARSARISNSFVSSKRLNRLKRMKERAVSAGYSAKKADHVIIVGFGINGQNLALVLRELETPYVVLELNINTVKTMKNSGQPIYFGDGTSVEILHKINIEKARIIVVTIPDPSAMRNIVKTAKTMNPSIYVVVRTRFMAEVEALHSIGADEVIPEEFETSIEIFSRVLKFYHMPPALIRQYSEKVRQNHYRFFTKKDTTKRLVEDKVALMPNIESERFTVEEGSHFDNNTFKEIEISYDIGYSIVAVKRGSQLISSPDLRFVFKPGDIVFAIGDRKSLIRLNTFFIKK
ncbi:sodium/hydrogen exchanger [Candidatus Magnetoovum chiemensis]|nr:sodium/hydrogen exchanger [Candidatus Magnetoovum chiemensis]